MLPKFIFKRQIVSSQKRREREREREREKKREKDREREKQGMAESFQSLIDLIWTSLAATTI